MNVKKHCSTVGKPDDPDAWRTITEYFLHILFLMVLGWVVSYFCRELYAMKYKEKKTQTIRTQLLHTVCVSETRAGLEET